MDTMKCTQIKRGSEMLSPVQVAEALNVSVETVYRAARRGELGAKKVFGQWRIPAEQVFSE